MQDVHHALGDFLTVHEEVGLIRPGAEEAARGEGERGVGGRAGGRVAAKKGGKKDPHGVDGG